MSRSLPRRAWKILVADDQEDVGLSIRLVLRAEGCEVSIVRTPGMVLETLRQSTFDLLLLDMNFQRATTSGAEGLELIRQIRATDTRTPIVVMTAWGTIELALQAMRLGAQDFLQKPWEPERLTTTVRNLLQLKASEERQARLDGENRLLRAARQGTFLARSPAMQPVLHLIERVGPSEANVLITGENGTGKSMIAELIHQHSPRTEGPFIAVNMGGLAEGVFESELFGHVKGAFTDAREDRTGRFELAQGGTLFLDEIVNLPAAQQQKLLRVLETGHFERVGSSRTLQADVRLISATNGNMAEEIARGRMREDLFYRLNTIHLHLPPLRERREDIPLLAEHFLQRHAQRYRRVFTGFSAQAMERLMAYAWPGNIRQLNHTIERAVLLASDEVLPRH